LSYYYPQAAIVLKVTFEDFDDKTADTQNLQTLYTLPILARRVEVNINDYTQADTFSCEIDYRNFPFDPRCIRSCGVKIHMENMEGLFYADGTPRKIVPDEDNAVFIGFADEETISFDDEHRVVRMEGRDYTALLIDLKFPAQKLDISRPLDSLIQGFLTANIATAALQVDNRTGTNPLPSIAQFAGKFDPQTTKKNPKANESLWELFQELIARSGLIMYIELDKLVISKPRVLYNRALTKQFVYGQNLRSLEYKRKLGRKKGFNIRCVSLNVSTKSVEEALIPKESTKEWSDDIGITQDEITIPQINADGSKGDDKPAPYMTFRFPNMVKKQLIEVGQKIFEEVGRQQLEGSFQTKEMLVPERVDTDKANIFDVTKIRCGTPIEVHIDQGDMRGISALSSVDQKARFLEKRGYETSVARALALSLNKFHPRFYTKAVTFTADEDSGFMAKIDFINFIELDNARLGDV
jgi:hypothetical protein